MTKDAKSIGQYDEHQGPLRIKRSEPDQRNEALTLLLSGRTKGSITTVQHFQAFARQQNLSLKELWVAYRGNQPMAAGLIVPTAGRTGMAFLSPITHESQVPHSSRLLATACQQQDPTTISLIQMLLDPDQTLEAQTLAAAGFTPLAHLVYMLRALKTAPALRPVPLNFQILQWSEANRETFATAILASYEQTRDCPRLLGLRHIDDIINGHMAAGIFRPDLWWAICCENQPIGVLLVNLVPKQRAAELVYLGLSPPWRGKGIARQFVFHALGLAYQHGAETMTLAVDQENQPAIRLYQSVGFTSTEHKIAMIFTLE